MHTLDIMVVVQSDISSQTIAPCVWCTAIVNRTHTASQKVASDAAAHVVPYF